MDAGLLIENVRLATMDASHARPYGLIEDAALLTQGPRIAWLGARAGCPAATGATRLDAGGALLTPGLIDCHTHLVYGGNRAAEFEARCRGASYEQIARAGGGIRSTVAATRAASEQQLLDSALARLDCLRREGVTTVEIKSGYGLDAEHEMRMLRVARELGRRRPVTICTTLLAAHALADDYAARSDEYIDSVCSELVAHAAREGLADAVDVFCENIAFSVAQCQRVFAAARRAGLPVKAHAEQLAYLGGARAAAEAGALSVDHLEYLPEADIAVLKHHGTVAVLLPGAFYFLRETRQPPVAALRAAGVPMAVATDLNPGSSPMASLLLAMNQSCVLFGLEPEEALAGATRHAARALGLQQHKGMLRAGMDADFALWDVALPAELCYGLNMVRPRSVWQGGVNVASG